MSRMTAGRLWGLDTGDWFMLLRRYCGGQFAGVASLILPSGRQSGAKLIVGPPIEQQQPPASARKRWRGWEPPTDATAFPT